MPFGYAGCPNNYSRNHSSHCDWHIRNPIRRSSGNRLRAGADCWNIPPSFHKNSCDRLHRWFHACSDRNRSYTPGSRFVCKWHHFHSPEPMYGFRSPGMSKNHTNQNRGLYTHKSLNSEHNGTYSTHNTPDDLWMCASWKRRCPARNTVCSLGRCRQCRWTRETQPSRALS